MGKNLIKWLKGLFNPRKVKVVIIDGHDLKKVKLSFVIGHRVAFWKSAENHISAPEIIAHEATNRFHQFLKDNPSLIKEKERDSRKTSYEVTFYINPRIY